MKFTLPGTKLFVKTFNQGKSNVYIQKVVLNGEELKRNYLLHDDIIHGGEIVFYLGSRPNKKWGL
jgi:putative alpha-1,2-mannosidase